jgi:Protein of unknown function (DUF2934)
MVSKRVSPAKKTTKRKAAAPVAAEPADNLALAVLQFEQTTARLSMNIDPDVRRQLVATEAYFLAERRGFAPGHELEDWAAAEAVVESRLHPMQAV